jgi:hypothetical protein
MSTCGRLFPVDKVYAYFVAADKHVVIVADVFLNPTADQVQICPNPIAIPPSREFLVIGTTAPGIHPQLVVKRRISTTYASDLTPKSVIVYTQGTDAPERHEVLLGAGPPPPLAPDRRRHRSRFRRPGRSRSPASRRRSRWSRPCRMP